MVYLRSLTATEPAMAAAREAEPPTAVVCKFWNAVAVTATPVNDVVSPGELPVRTWIAPAVPAAVIVSLAPMYASVFSVSTTVETAAPTLALPPTSSWPASVVTAD